MINKTKHLTQGDRIVKCVCMSPAVAVQGAMIQEMVKCDSKRSLRTYSQVLLYLYLVSRDRKLIMPLSRVTRLGHPDPDQDFKLSKVISIKSPSGLFIFCDLLFCSSS